MVGGAPVDLLQGTKTKDGRNSSHEHCYSGRERVEKGKAPLACRRNLEAERGVVILDAEGMQRPVRL